MLLSDDDYREKADRGKVRGAKAGAAKHRCVRATFYHLTKTRSATPNALMPVFPARPPSGFPPMSHWLPQAPFGVRCDRMVRPSVGRRCFQGVTLDVGAVTGGP